MARVGKNDKKQDSSKSSDKTVTTAFNPYFECNASREGTEKSGVPINIIDGFLVFIFSILLKLASSQANSEKITSGRR